MSSITRVLHTTTWNYFTSRLPDRFSRSPKVVKEAVMTDIDDLVQEFWRTSSNGVVEECFFAIHRLFDILQQCFNILKVCFDIIFVFATAILADKNLQMPNSWLYSAQSDLDERIRAKFKIMFDGYRKMFDQSFSTLKSKDLGDMLRFLPGVVVQKHMSMQGMTDLYRIKPELLKHLIKSIIEPLKMSDSFHTPTYWKTICLVSCRTEIVLSSITAIPCFNIYLFADISCLYCMDLMP